MSNQLSKHTRNKLQTLLANTGDMALKRRARRIIEEINPGEKDSILEVGCGDGYYLHLLSNLGIPLKLIGCDVDARALESARQNLKDKKVKLIVADVLQKLPFPPRSFDKIIMSEVCEHLSDDVAGLKEVQRVLKKNGTIVLTVPNHNYPFFWDPINWTLEHLVGTHIKSGFWAGLWNQHLRLYTLDEIGHSVEKAGFAVENKESLTWWCLPFNHYFVNVTARLLATGLLPRNVSSSLSKYEHNTFKKQNIIFGFLNLLDRLNDIYTPRNAGVGVLVKGIKR